MFFNQIIRTAPPVMMGRRNIFTKILRGCKWIGNVIIIFIAIPGFSQKDTNTNVPWHKKIYIKALKHYCDYNAVEGRSTLDTYYIKKTQISDKIPLEFKNYRFVKIDSSQLYVKSEADKNFSYLEVSQAENAGKYYYVPIKRIWLKNSANKEVEYIVTDKVKIEFEYRKRKLLFSRILVSVI